MRVNGEKLLDKAGAEAEGGYVDIPKTKSERAAAESGGWYVCMYILIG